MTNFVRAANPIWWIPDLTGFPLNDEYYAFFLTNDLPYTFQAVFQDPNGISPWPAPLQFQPAGTLPNNLYFDERLTYRIEIRHGNTSQDQLIYLIENFIPGINLTPQNTAILTADNMFTNPQFADVYFVAPPGSANPTMTYVQAVVGTYSFDVGPGWRIDLEGAGTITLTQVPIEGISGIEGDPTYYLRIQNSGWTSVKLVQRFTNNGAIFGDGAIAVAFTAQANGSNQGISVQYVPNVTVGIPPDIFSDSVLTGGFAVYKRAINLDPSTNNTSDGAAYVDIVFNLANPGDISLTNTQIVGQSGNLPPAFNAVLDAPDYNQQTYERTVDQEFNTYKTWLFQKRIPSLLAAWDFPLNPAQFFGRSVPVQAVGANKSYYAWDQTILFQSANSAITVSSPASNDLTLTAAVNTRIGVIQYLDTIQTRELLSGRLSVNIAATSTTVGNVGIPCTVSLWYTNDATLPDIKSPNFNSIVLTLGTNGKPATFNGTWIEIPRNNLQDATFTVTNPPSSGEYNDYNFMGWEVVDKSAINSATFFAIVIGTSTVTAGDSIHFNSVGMMNGNIATRPAPQTIDEVLRECQFYYEKSYKIGDSPGTVTRNNSYYALQAVFATGGPTQNAVAMSFSINYKVNKRVNIPTLTVYSPDSAVPGNVSVFLFNGGANVTPGAVAIVPFAHWDASALAGRGPDRIDFFGDSATLTSAAVAANRPDAFMFFHYTSDARLGVI